MTATSARRQAHRILSKAPYTHPKGRPGLLTRILDDIGHWIEDAVRPAWHWLDHNLFHPVHGALGAWWPVPVAAVLVVAGLLASRLVVQRRVRHRALADPTAGAAGSGSAAPDPAELEREADAAEDAGRYSDAVRLRFRAGLARLERHGLIADGAMGTDRALARELGSPTFGRLAATHEAVTYADHRATSEDAAAAHRLWPQVPPEVRQTRAEQRGDAA